MRHLFGDVSQAVLLLSPIVALRRKKMRNLPLAVEMIRKVGAGYLAVFKKFRVVGADNIPDAGPLIIVANHTAVYDPICLQVACKNRLIRFMQAREYYEMMPMNLVYRMFRAIPVNRTGVDTASFRTALRELTDNGCIGIFPEGRISEDGRLHDVQKGVALLALLSNAVIVPAYIQGTTPFSGMVRDFFRMNQVTLYFGPPIHLGDRGDRHKHKEACDAALRRIMDALATLQDHTETHTAA